MEVICEEGWVTQLLLEAAHERARSLHLPPAPLSTKPSLHTLFFLMEENAETQKGGDLVIRPCYALLLYHSFIYYLFFFIPMPWSEILNRSRHWNPFLGNVSLSTGRVSLYSYGWCMCLGPRAAGTDLLSNTMHNQVEENKDVGSTNSVCADRDGPGIQNPERTVVLSQDRHRGKGTQWRGTG